jgi:hypothetical protein
MAPAISTVAVNPGIYAAATGGERRAGRFSKVRAVRNAADPSLDHETKEGLQNHKNRGGETDALRPTLSHAGFPAVFRSQSGPWR